MNIEDFPQHRCSMSLTHNQHKDYYESIEDYVAQHLGNWKDDASRLRAIDTNEIWELQWYPRTPIGFHCALAPTLKEVLEFAKSIEHETTPTHP